MTTNVSTISKVPRVSLVFECSGSPSPTQWVLRRGSEEQHTKRRLRVCAHDSGKTWFWSSLRFLVKVFLSVLFMAQVVTRPIDKKMHSWPAITYCSSCWCRVRNSRILPLCQFVNPSHEIQCVD